MPERAFSGIVTPEIAIVTQATSKVFSTGTGSHSIILFLGRRKKFRRGQKRRVVVNDVFLVVIAVFAVTVDALLFGQMFKRLLGRRQILIARKVALQSKPCSTSQSGNRHATAFAERRLVIRTLDTVRTRERANFTFAHGATPVVEHGHVEVALVGEHAHQEVRAVSSFIRRFRLGRCRRQQLRNAFRSKRKRPNSQRNLLRIQVVRIREMAQILAHVAARIVPTAMHIDLLVGLIDTHAFVPAFDSRVVRTVIVEIIEHSPQRILRERVLAHRKFAGLLRLPVLGNLQSIFAGFNILQFGHIELAVVQPVIRIRASRELAGLHGASARHQAEFSPVREVIAPDNHGNGLIGIIPHLVVEKFRVSRNSSRAQKNGSCHREKRS